MREKDLLSLVDSFADLRIAVVGDAMLDSYSCGTANRLCREAPAPIVTLGARTNAPGGAANTAANAAALGAQVRLIAVVGDDPEGMMLRQSLAEQGVGTDTLLQVPHRETLAKHRVLAGSHMFVRVDQGTTCQVDEVTEARLLNALSDVFKESDAIVVSDYAYGVMTPRMIEELGNLQVADPRVLLVDAKNVSDYARAGATAVKPNYSEALSLAGLGPGGDGVRPDTAALLGERVLERSGARIAAVTLDSEGALIFEQGAPPYRTYARHSEGTYVAGAGDTFAAALALALAAGATTTEAAEVASAAAGGVVTKEGTAVCWAEELRGHLAAENKYASNAEYLAVRLSQLRQQGKRIVFTNGCFDLVHRGHVTYLSEAKAEGEVLIVGVNSDESTRRLKGSERPINPLDDRLSVLAAMSCVDYVIPFDEDTPKKLIATLRPDVFVKGGDYTRETLPEATLVESLGGIVRILPFVEDHSTTQLIQKVQQAFAADVT